MINSNNLPSDIMHNITYQLRIYIVMHFITFDRSLSLHSIISGEKYNLENDIF